MILLMKKKGFTLIELLIVVIIIGILAAIGIPQYAKSLEKARGAEAKEGIAQIYRAEIEYAGNRYGNYTNSLSELESVSEIKLMDRYWSYSIDTPTSITFIITATRSSGSHSGETMTIDQTATMAGNWEFL